MLKTGIRIRLQYLALLMVIVFLGLQSRNPTIALPSFIKQYSGDTLWAMMAFLLLSFLVPKLSLVKRSLYALAFCFCIEFSQLYHADWIDSLRATKIGALVLGHGFLWSDLICYSTGIGITTLGEWSLNQKRNTFNSSALN